MEEELTLFLEENHNSQATRVLGRSHGAYGHGIYA